MNETKPTLSQKILIALGTSHGLTRGQLVEKLGITRDMIRKPVAKLLFEGQITRTIADSGIETFRRGKATNGSGSRVVETSVINKPHVAEAAEHVGFAKGYATGVQEAQRSAYEAGKQSVIDKLVGVLR